MYEYSRELFKYRLKLSEVVKQDCEKLLLAYDNCKDLNFEAFVNVWQLIGNELIFTNDDFQSELYLYGSDCFFLITKYLMFGQSLYVKTGALYLLYSLYSMQAPDRKPNKIRLVPVAAKLLSKLEEQMRFINCEDFLYIFYQLEQQDAFAYTCTWFPLGYEHNFTLEVVMKNDIFQQKEKEPEPTRTSKSADWFPKDKSVEELEVGMREYEEALKNYEEVIGRAVGLRGATSIIDCINEVYGTTPEEKECADESEIYLKRKDIRMKAFSSNSQQENNLSEASTN